jgi:hypothetical protein
MRKANVLLPWRYPVFRLLQFTAETAEYPANGTSDVKLALLGAPYWFTVVIGGGLYYWLSRRHRFPFQNTMGVCRPCGYDLRATPQSVSRMWP